MAISVISRPTAEIYETNSPGQYDPVLHESFWNSSQQPNIYELESDLFPTNNVDSSITATIEDNGGLVQIPWTAHSFTALDYIKITDSGDTDVLPEGVYQIVSTETDSITIDISYDSAFYVTAIKYYNNYHGLIKVYAGLPPDHTFNSQKPQTLIGTIRATFSSNNRAKVDVSGLIRDQVNTEWDNDSANLPVDLDIFSAYYIEYAESYDQISNGDIATFTSAYTEDTYGNCESEITLENEEFDSNLDSWVQEPIENHSTYTEGDEWYYSSGASTVNLAPKPVDDPARISDILYQEITLSKDVTYTINFEISSYDNCNMAVAISEDSFASDFEAIYSSNSGTSETVTFSLTPSKNISAIGFYVFHYNESSNLVSVERFALSATFENPCLAQFWCINGVKQFQDHFAQNFADYVLHSNNELRVSRPLTNFRYKTFDPIGAVFGTAFKNTSAPVYFKGEDFSLSYIIPSSLFSSASVVDGDEQVFLQILFFDDTNLLIFRKELLIENLDSGVYRFFLTEENYALTFTGTLEEVIDELEGRSDVEKISHIFASILIKPTNIFIDGWSGTFDYAEFNGSPATNAQTAENWNITPLIYDGVSDNISANPGGPVYRTSVGVVGPQSGDGCLGFSASHGNMTPTEYLKVCSFDTPVSVVQNRVYELKGYALYNENGFTPNASTNHNNLGRMLVVPAGYGVSDLITEDGAEIGTEVVEGWREFSCTFNTGSNSTLTFELVEIISSSSIGSGGWSFFFDSITLKGPYEYVTESSIIKVNDECATNSIYLTWLNSLGGWDGWKFTAEKVYSDDFGDVIELNRDVRENWPTSFSSGETINDLLEVNSWRSIRVNSQYLSKGEIDAISEIKRSIKVQMYNTDGSKKTVIVDKAGFELYQDGDNLYSISFDIRLPNYSIQSQ